MRPTSLLLGALVLLPFTAEGQEIKPEVTPSSVTVRPVDVVAERVRNILFGDPNWASLVELAEIIPETSIGSSERVAADIVVPAADQPRGAEADVSTVDAPAVAEVDDIEPVVESAAADVEDIEPVVASAAAEVDDAEPIETADVDDVLAADVQAIDALATTDLPVDEAPLGATTTAEVLDVVAMGPAWAIEAPLPVVPTLAVAEVSFVDRLRTINVETLFRLLAWVFVLIGIAALLGHRGEGFALKPAGVTRRGPVVDARALVAKGVPLHEVTRRTGLGRDALALLAHRKPS